MFLVSSIRRRLVSGFVVAMLLMLVLAGAGIAGLIWHQEMVDDLSFQLYKSPNRTQLIEKISLIGHHLFLFRPTDLRQPESVMQLRGGFRQQVDSAVFELGEFRGRIEALQQSPELHQQRNKVLIRLDGIAAELGRLLEYSARLRLVTTVAERDSYHALQAEVMSSVLQIRNALINLPAYERPHADWLLLSLTKERERTERLLHLILLIAAITIAVFGLTIYLGFRWISIPLRTVSRGATRIANGDTTFRLAPASRWQDEFSDLVEGVNCMANRFQQAEEELQAKVRERSEQLVRSQRLASVGFLAAGVAHEINNPLSAISMASESLEMRLLEWSEGDTRDISEMRDRLAMIRRESRRCGEITRRLLDFSRGERSVKAIDDLTRIIQEVVAMLRHLGDYSDRTIRFDRAEPLMLQINSAQIKQVVLNIVANALQATAPGGNVTIDLTEQVDSVSIVVRDDGSGMDPETLQHVFDPFFTTKDAGQGTGLGLSITHRLVEDHHGTILPSSDGPGEGSTFRIRLPKRQPAASAA